MNGNGNGHAIQSDDRDYSDTEVIRAAFVANAEEHDALREADGDIAEGIGALAGGIARIEAASRVQYSLSELSAIHIRELNDARRSDNEERRSSERVTKKQILDLRAELTEFRARGGSLDPEEIRARARLESKVEHLQKATEELEEDVEDTKRQDLRKAIEAAARANAGEAEARAAMRASSNEIVLEKKATWSRREQWLLSLVAAAVLLALSTYLGMRTAAPAPTHQTPPAQEQHP